MNTPETLKSDKNPQSPAAGIKLSALLLFATLPLLLLGLAGAWMITSDPLQLFNTAAPPVENLTFERVILDDNGIRLKVRAGGSEPMKIAQVQVDSAYWKFSQTPPGPLPRMSSAWLQIPYPWVAGDTHTINIVTNTGITFKYVIDVAIQTPTNLVGGLRAQAILGTFVGILPVAIGLLFFPLMRKLGREGMRFLLTMTLGMLVFLLIDTLEGALDFAVRASAAFQGTGMVLLVAGTTCLALIAIGRRQGSPSGLALATFISLGIGLHNLGEGLAIGSALSAGSAGLGAFLIMGFSIHNITEGIAIAAPMVRIKRPTILIFFGLALLAGAPAIGGIWLGSYAIAPQWAALALAIGTGAILQVLFEVGSYVIAQDQDKGLPLDRYALTGFIVGIGFMYFTAMVIKI